MKKIVFSIVFVLGAFAAICQTNTLVFNQVITLGGNSTQNSYVIGTVPSGKVWKIEHMAGYRSGGYMPDYIFNINGSDTYSLYSLALTSYYYPNKMPSGPIWLKAGDQVKVLYGSGSSPVYYFISAIEFNVVTI
ncbi:MAG: hypothetical protein WCM76_13380 [Bacteroidota bacterium]